MNTNQSKYEKKEERERIENSGRKSMGKCNVDCGFRLSVRLV